MSALIRFDFLLLVNIFFSTKSNKFDHDHFRSVITKHTREPTRDFHDDRPFLKHELHERNDLIELVRLEKKNRPPARFFFLLPLMINRYIFLYGLTCMWLIVQRTIVR